MKARRKVARPPGRPPVDEHDTSVQVGVTLPSRKYDELCEQARKQGTSVPEVVRRLIYGQPDELEKKSKK